MALCVGYRSTYQNKCFGMIAALVRHSWSPVGSILMHGGARWRVSPATCWQIWTEIPCYAALYSIVLHVEYMQCAHGTSGIVVRQPQEDGRLLWLLQPVIDHSGQLYQPWTLQPPPATSAAGTWRTDTDHFEFIFLAGLSRESRKRAHCIRDIHTHAWVTRLTIQMRLHAMHEPNR